VAKVSDVYSVVTYDLLEDENLVLGILTFQQFIDMLNQTTLDFLTATGIIKAVYTQSIFAGVSQYSIPDEILRTDDAFLAGYYLPQSTQMGLNNSIRNWRRVQGIPSAWHEDGLPIKTIELAVVPNYNGLYIPGPNEPDPPHAAYGSWWVPAYPSGGGAAVVTSPQATRALTIVGPEAPTAVANLDDAIPLIPDDICLAYIPFGVLYRIFSADSEERDLARADFCAAEYAEGVNLMKAITGEVEAQ
jgi:hypothetical protein